MKRGFNRSWMVISFRSMICTKIYLTTSQETKYYIEKE